MLVLENDFIPLFGAILCVSNQYSFVCVFILNVFLHIIMLTRSPKLMMNLYRLCTISDLCDHNPLSKYTLDSHRMYVCMKYYITEDDIYVQ